MRPPERARVQPRRAAAVRLRHRRPRTCACSTSPTTARSPTAASSRTCTSRRLRRLPARRGTAASGRAPATACTCYDPDGTLIGKVLVPGDRGERGLGRATSATASTSARRRLLYAVLLPVRGAKTMSTLVDLHVHYPMHLLGGVEDPRDVPARHVQGLRPGRRTTLRAAVLAIAARLFNFRHWDSDWRVTMRCWRRAAYASRAACCTARSARWISTSHTARRPRAHLAKLIELLEATERRSAARRGRGAPRGGSRRARETRSSTASRAGSTSAPRRRGRRERPRARRPGRVVHHAGAPVLAPRRDEHAGAAVPPRRGLQPGSSRRRAPALTDLGGPP